MIGIWWLQRHHSVGPGQQATYLQIKAYKKPCALLTSLKHGTTEHFVDDSVIGKQLASRQAWYYSNLIVGDDYRLGLNKCRPVNKGHLLNGIFQPSCTCFDENHTHQDQPQGHAKSTCKHSPSQPRTPELTAAPTSFVTGPSFISSILALPMMECFGLSSLSHRRRRQSEIDPAPNSHTSDPTTARVPLSAHIRVTELLLSALSRASHGPNYVSLGQQVFCDMSHRVLWPLCSIAITRVCYGLKRHTIIPRKLGGAGDANDDVVQCGSHFGLSIPLPAGLG